MSKEKENLRQQQCKIEPSIEGSIEASKKIIVKCLLLSEVQIAQNFFIYASMSGEVMTDDLISILLAQGKTVCIPKIVKVGTMIPVEIKSLKELSIDQHGFREPQAQVPFKKRIDLVIVPGLAFDQWGNRLGHGGGYYDRYFEMSPQQNSVALAFDWQILPEIPIESHDHQIDIVVTPDHTYG